LMGGGGMAGAISKVKHSPKNKEQPAYYRNNNIYDEPPVQ